MSFIPKVHEIYKHFKGGLYQITAIAEHTETGEQLVVYQALYGDFRTYARPLQMFTGRVDRVKYPEATQEFRFELQGPESDRQKTEAGAQEPVAVTQKAETSAQEPVAATQKAEAGAQEPVAATQKAETGTQKAVATPQKPDENMQTNVTPAQKAEPEKQEPSELELVLDPLVLEFLDTDSYEQKLNILAGLHHRITDDMITTMAIACDIEVNEGDTEERYESLKTCIMTLEKYECNRLRQ